MIKFQLHEVSPRLPTGELHFTINEEIVGIKYYNKNPFIPIQQYAGHSINGESYPSYLVKLDDCWIYGTYVEIKRAVNG